MVGITAGEKIIIEVASAPYRGEYQVQVLQSTREKVLVTMPVRGEGMIVPLAGGEEVTIKYRGGSYRGLILNRSFGSQPALTVTAPGALSLTGRSAKDGARFIAVTSGKGGVGKSTLSINLSLALVSLGLKVCMVDVDLGTANLDLMFGIAVLSDLGDLLEGKSLEDVLIPVAPGLTLLPGSSGVGEIANLSTWQLGRLVSTFNKLADDYDVIILDTGAGVAGNVTGFLQAADQVLLVITPDPTAITDAYALLKVVKSKGELHGPWNLVVNKSTANDADVIQTNFCRTAFRHLEARITYLGSVPESQHVAMSVRRQQPFLLRGGGEEAKAYHKLAHQIAGLPLEKKGFLQRFQAALQRFTE